MSSSVLEYAYRLEIIHKIDKDIILNIIENSPDHLQYKQIQILLNGNRHEMIESNPLLKSVTNQGVVDEKIVVRSKSTLHLSALQFLSFLNNKFILRSILQSDEGPQNVIDYLNSRINGHSMNRAEAQSIIDFAVVDGFDEIIKSFSEDIKALLQKTLHEWKREIDIWQQMIDKYEKYFNNILNVVTISVISAGVKSKVDDLDEYKNLLQNNLPICKRARYARLRSGNAIYWDNIFNQLQTFEETIFSLLVFFTWATPKTIFMLSAKVNKILDSLSEEQFKIIYRISKTTCYLNLFKRMQLNEIHEQKNNMNDALKLVLSNRMEESEKYKYVYSNFKTNNVRSIETYSIGIEFLVQKFLEKTDDQELLEEIKRIYANTAISNEKVIHYRIRQHDTIQIPIDIAKKIMSHPKQYPRIIASIAERSCRIYANENRVSVGFIAQKDAWFD